MGRPTRLARVSGAQPALPYNLTGPSLLCVPRALSEWAHALATCTTTRSSQLAASLAVPTRPRRDRDRGEAAAPEGPAVTGQPTHAWHCTALHGSAWSSAVCLQHGMAQRGCGHGRGPCVHASRGKQSSHSACRAAQTMHACMQQATQLPKMLNQRCMRRAVSGTHTHTPPAQLASHSSQAPPARGQQDVLAPPTPCSLDQPRLQPYPNTAIQ